MRRGSLNLLVISERFWPEGSGGTLATYLITKLLATSGIFKITVMTGTCNPARIDGVNFIVDEAFRIPYKPARWTYFLNRSAKKRYKSLIRNFDIIYIPYGYPFLSLAKELGKKVVAHLHDYQPVSYNSTILCGQQESDLAVNVKTELAYELFEHGSHLRAVAGSLFSFLNSLCRTWMREADVIICVSKRHAKIISNLAPELAPKIKIVYNPLPRASPMEEKFEHPSFTYSGGGSYIKGFHVFLKTLLNILKVRNDVTSFLTGGLRSFNTTQMKVIERLNDVFKGKFKLLGFLLYNDVLKLYSRSHAVLVPSIWEEPLPYVVIEAMLCGTIPIASRVGGIPEVVEGTFAERMLFEPGNVNQCVDRIVSLLGMSKEQMEDVGFDLREAVLKRFNPETIKKELVDILTP